MCIDSINPRRPPIWLLSMFLVISGLLIYLAVYVSVPILVDSTTTEFDGMLLVLGTILFIFGVVFTITVVVLIYKQIKRNWKAIVLRKARAMRII